MLTDAALGPVRRWLPGPGAASRLAAKLAVRPDKVARRGAGLAAELAKIAVGRSEVEPRKGDRRFKDPAWARQPGLQAAAAGLPGHGPHGRPADLRRRPRLARASGACASRPRTWSTRSRRRNVPLTNPAVLKATIDTGGQQLRARRGATSRATWRKPPRIPSMVDTSAFEVGENLAVTPGAVVLRTPVFELIQYEPQTAQVRERPLLRHAADDQQVLRHRPRAGPQHDRARWSSSGQQVFAISWRNPDERHADWELDTYAQAVVEALDAVEAITGTDATHVLGLCAGGIVLSTRRRAPGRERRAGPHRRPDARRLRARQRAGRHGRRDHRPGDGRARHRRLGAARLPRRPLAGRRLRLAAARTT